MLNVTFKYLLQILEFLLSINTTSRIKHFDLNTVGRDFVVGDIHGCFSLLQYELDRLNFDEYTDRLFSVGDLVDRGGESRSCLNWLSKPWFHAILGNHEDIFLRFCLGKVDDYYMTQVGGQWAKSLTKDQCDMYADAFEQLPIAIDIQTTKGLVGVVHAECPELSWRHFVKLMTLSKDIEFEKLKHKCLWGRIRISNDLRTCHTDVHKIIVGHSRVDQPTLLGNVQYIDTGAAYGRYLTVMELI